MSGLERLTHWLNRLLVFVGGVFLVGMIVLTCANIASRAVWAPIRGTFELMGYFGAVVTAAALAYTQLHRGHIAVNVLIQRFSRQTQRRLNGFNNVVCALFFSILSWQIALKAHGFMKTGEVSETLRVIFYPFTYLVAAGCGVLALVFLRDLLKAIRTRNGAAQ
ncbi:MAG: TRAP transporter small permease [Desulfobacterales bacterium]|jgi:TRAP-type C4-dicarboxylate transport system permease small subunit